MELTLEQVLKLAPDASAAAAGRKLASIRNWQTLGRDSAALWGECQGSALYQVRVDLSNLGYSCSCPSRKFPCKHVLGLLLLVAQSPGAVAEGAPPEWVDQWLSKRQAKAEKKVEKEQQAAAKPVDEQARARRADQRDRRVREGLERFDLWLCDLVRSGIAGLASQPPGMWSEQSRRLVDAQAPGLASRVGRLAAIPGSSRDWPRKLLAELGLLKLAVHAYQRLDQLEPALGDEVRQLVGWTVGQDELHRGGETVDDVWCVVGQWVDDEERLRVQRSWLVGEQSGRTALVLQFSPGNTPFAESIVPGTRQSAALVYYPGVARQRARYYRRDGAVESITGRVPGCSTIGGLLDLAAQSLARSPWTARVGAVLHDVTVVVREPPWAVRDSDGNGVPLAGGEHWRLLALSAGAPFDLAVEWDGAGLRPLGIWLQGSYRVCAG